MVDGAGKLPRRVYGEERVIAVHIHAERHSRVAHENADGAQADDAQLFAGNLRTHVGALALFDELSDLRALVLERFRPGDAVHNFAGAEEERSQHKFLHGVGVGARRVEHHNALLAAFVERNVVHARAGARDGQQPRAEGHLVHGRGAHQDGLRVLHVRPADVIGAEAGGARLGNFIQALNVVHGNHPFSFSKFCMKATSFSTPSTGMAL